MSMEAILIPVKRLGKAKERLSAILTPSDRRALGLAMLADVLRASEKWTARIVVTSDPDAEAVAIALGCTLLEDPGLGLNPAISSGTERATELGATAMLVLPSDIPLVSSDDLTFLFGFDADVVVARSSDGGTGALLRRPPGVIPPAFGPGSAARHVAEARAGGLVVAEVDRPSLALDIDLPQDLQALAAAAEPRESVRIAREITGRIRNL